MVNERTSQNSLTSSTDEHSQFQKIKQLKKQFKLSKLSIRSSIFIVDSVSTISVRVVAVLWLPSQALPAVLALRVQNLEEKFCLAASHHTPSIAMLR